MLQVQRCNHTCLSNHTCLRRAIARLFASRTSIVSRIFGMLFAAWFAGGVPSLSIATAQTEPPRYNSPHIVTPERHSLPSSQSNLRNPNEWSQSERLGDSQSRGVASNEYSLGAQNAQTNSAAAPDQRVIGGQFTRRSDSQVVRASHETSLPSTSGISTSQFPYGDGSDSASARSISDNQQRNVGDFELPPPSSALATDSPRPKSSVGLFLNTLFALFVVIGLYFLVMVGMRKMGGGVGQAKLPRELVHVLGKETLAGRQQLMVIRFGPKLLLVSQQLGQTETLAEIDDPLEVDRLSSIFERNRDGSVSQSFAEVFHDMASRSISRFSGSLSATKRS